MKVYKKCYSSDKVIITPEDVARRKFLERVKKRESKPKMSMYVIIFGKKTYIDESQIHLFGREFEIHYEQ